MLTVFRGFDGLTLAEGYCQQSFPMRPSRKYGFCKHVIFAILMLYVVKQ